MTRRVVIIQARMTSTRLPGKVLLELAGRPMLSQQLARLRACKNVDELCIATTTNATDDPIVALAHNQGVTCFRGDEHDVLSRYLGAARQTRAQLVVRVTSDCPLIDPGVTDRVIAAALEEGCDYASNTLARTYPRGLDTEAFFMDALERCARLATSTPAREHVTWFMHTERPELFVRRSVVDEANHADLRWTVDTPDDLALVRAIYELAGPSEAPLAYAELVAEVVRRPRLLSMNADVRQKAE